MEKKALRTSSSSSSSSCAVVVRSMAAEVSSVLRMMGSRYDTKSKKAKGVAAETKRSDLVTMDLLGGGGGGGPDSKELDLEIKPLRGWEKQLGLSSGDLFFDRSSENRNTGCSRRLDVPNFTPIPTAELFRPPPTVPNLELELFSSSSPTGYQSVCTLDKVKFALERIKNPKPNPSSYSPSSSSTSSSIRQQKEKRNRIDEEEEEESVSMSPSMKEAEEGDGKKELQAAGCPSCLSYVLVARENPKCPRCNCLVPFPVVKKPRIDLNSSIVTNTAATISSFSFASALSEIS